MDAISKIWCPSWSRLRVSPRSQFSGYLWSCLQADWSQGRRTCSLNPSRHRFHPGFGFECVLSPDSRVQPKWPQDKKITLWAAKRWWRTLSSFPEAVTRGDTLCLSSVFLFSYQKRLRTVRASGNQTIVSPIRRSLAWVCVSARPGQVSGLQTRSSAWSRGHRYCTAAAASCLNTSSPHSLCFRFPLPAHDCLTMGGNGS